MFNFYRPGYIAPGSETGAAGMTVPELQITNSSSVVGYTNFLSFFAFGDAQYGNASQKTSFIPDYSGELPLASNPDALIDRLDLELTAGAMSTETRNNIKQVLATIPLTNETDPNYDGPGLRVSMAIVLTMTSPDYIVQR